MSAQTAEQTRMGCKRTSVWVVAFTLLGISAVTTAAGGQETASNQPPALREEPLVQYRAFRRMHARNERFNHEAWLDAWTELDANGFRYEIVSQRGSETVLKKVLRTLLEREQELIAAGEAERADFTPANYRFEETDSAGRGVRYILIKPRREDILLVDGRLVLNQDGTQLLRVEGVLSKNPSFWTNLVNVIREFAVLDGVRVPVSTESIAKLKFAGISRMDVRYEYESINGRPVSVAARRTMAAAVAR